LPFLFLEPPNYSSRIIFYALRFLYIILVIIPAYSAHPYLSTGVIATLMHYPYTDKIGINGQVCFSKHLFLALSSSENTVGRL